MPASFRRQGQDSVTLRQIINYHAYDDARVPDILAGKTMGEVGADKFDGDLLGDDPQGNYGRYADAASTSVREYLWHITC
jgi:hypothetical protein